MIKVLYFNTEDLRNEIQKHDSIDELKRFIESEAEVWIGVERDDPEFIPTEAVKENSSCMGSKDVYYERHFGYHHVWILL